MIKKNQTYEIEITGMNHEGQGVGRLEGMAVFVDGGIKGEKALVKINEVKKNYATSTIESILSNSQGRIEPPCGNYEKCGGCSLMHMNYKAQLEFKTELVRETLRRIGKLEEVKVNDTIGMNNPYNYRNKIQFPVALKGGKPVMGFYERRSHNVADSSLCLIQDDTSSLVRQVVLEFLSSYKISIYDEKTGSGLLRHVMVRKGFKTGEVMVVLVVNGDSISNSDKLIENLKDKVEGLTSVFLNINKRNTNIILGEKNKKLFGRDTITDYIGRFKFDISPLSFFQVNPVQTEVLYGKALEFAQLAGNETVFDLYCGIGTISLFLSEKAKQVYGIEVVEDAIKDAKKNAAANGVDNAEFIAGEAERVIPGMYEKGIKADVVVVDPPRKGCDQVVLETMVKMQPSRIVYVSCNPSTLARDLNYLAENGYRVDEVQPVDMFPHTAHTEVCCLIVKA